MDFAAGFAQQRIVHGRGQRLGRLQMARHDVPHQVQNRLLVKSVLRVKAKVGRPILLQVVLRARQTGDGMAAKSGQAAEHVPGGVLEGLHRAKTVASVFHESIQTV